MKSNDSTPSTSDSSFINRVVGNDSFKKGAAAAAAGLLVAVISEAIWPSS